MIMASVQAKPKGDSNQRREKVVLITGGSRGIGEGCVRNFAASGWSTVFCAPKGDQEEGRMLETELNSEICNSTFFVACDVTIEQEIKNLIESCLNKYGRLDCVINCAGWHPPSKTVDQFSSAEFTALFNLNVLGTFLVIKYALPHLRRTGGNVVNIASIVGCIGQERAVTYVATKGAVEAMTKALAIDEALHGVRVNCVSPGNISTPLMSSFVSATGDAEKCLEFMCSAQHIRRLGTSDEVAKACLFLASDATFTTGVNMLVTGGAELGFGAKQ